MEQLKICVQHKSTLIYKANINTSKGRNRKKIIVVIGDINSPFSTDRSPRHKSHKETLDLNYPLDHMKLSDTYRAFHPVAAECTFFSSTHRIFSRTDHVLGHKKSLNKFKKTEIILGFVSIHNGMRLEINKGRKIGKFTNSMWKLNNMLLNNCRIQKKS